MEHPKFRAAYDLLALRAEVEDNQEMLRLAEWWGEFEDATPARQKAMLSTPGRSGAAPRASTPPSPPGTA